MIENSEKYKIDLNVKDTFGRTAFHDAVVSGDQEIVIIFLEKYKEFGIDINPTDKHGNTPQESAKTQLEEYEYILSGNHNLDTPSIEDKENLEAVISLLENEYEKMNL